MPRAKRGFKRRRRHNKVLDRASGFVLGRKNKYKRTAEAVDRAFIYAFRDRRAKKRDFRQLWIARLSAAANNNELSYSKLIANLKKAMVNLDRKILADIAIADPATFSAIVNQVKA
ncbi:MAG TPA: 50S ribosomal protein L20 [Bdellovibrionales bacterium]|nr:MAG: 50S ribosomal protein L20 [Bdellovibrionales bacterium GWB1_52_6]OFZ06092.1 MAG: 50S ribosomal protein L20 [Bdellovibrionales bacterium GWA1_52_35]OFZ38680.1 MAG: 50S ribosomal protein L20 [Bdellovibrionales bacterium GWC1_52_8]HAR42988.1 50S ribosomal protein L20 [Bdellovibrionales bacterium]HCM39281.1 50S ribosomal protein L20 [Bdellovibrionales bacterium]